MSSFNEFLQSLTDPKQKRAFFFSLLAVLFWLVAISLALLTSSLHMQEATLAVYICLALAVLFSLVSMPKPTAHQASSDAHEADGHLQH
ncbi:MAG: hypothetical protein PVG66_06260 [Chromatiales bacterium]|jgi:hypothetical protein